MAEYRARRSHCGQRHLRLGSVANCGAADLSWIGSIEKHIRWFRVCLVWPPPGALLALLAAWRTRANTEIAETC
ncbi:hypothetical protein BHE74_00014892 [Ensete ventricosum]|uniref:Uncharacterized protein n=1 Tax=Ensete ventricosum TaxID=4639 RepID=A0A445M8M6_ENSVE|nr:hypothetical protein BHE74_00014892 [Ensete ventricosum]RZR70601.1 hypothetical protein BHM03_00000695 [Ensete ventricosum]